MLVEMHLIDGILPALCEGVGKGERSPDAFEGYDMLLIDRPDGFVKDVVDVFVVNSSGYFGAFTVAHRLVEKVIHCNGGAVSEP